MIGAGDFRVGIVQPVLKYLALSDERLNSPAVENLLVGTALMESRLSTFWQTQGPALSMFQIEPATFDDVYQRYLGIDHPAWASTVQHFLMPAFGALEQLPANQHFACAIARFRYWMVPEPLPQADDIDGLAEYWDKNYNKNPNKGFPSQWANLYRRYVR